MDEYYPYLQRILCDQGYTVRISCMDTMAKMLNIVPSGGNYSIWICYSYDFMGFASVIKMMLAGKYQDLEDESLQF